MSTPDGTVPYAYTLFSQPWWLNALAPGAWAEAVVRRGGEVAGRLPYMVRHRMGMTLLGMPPLTQTLGPWIAARDGKSSTVLGFEMEVMAELLAQLPPFDVFQQNFDYSLTNWLPFYWHGFEQTTRYTYVINDLTDLDEVWRGFQENVRRNIRKAQKQVRVQTEPDLRRMLEVNRLSYERQGMPLPYTAADLARLDRACAQRECRRMFFAEDDAGRTHAAIYIVWDQRSAYLLLSGGDPALRQSGAASLLIWEAIRFAAGVTERFDFEGSMVESIERFFRHFGGHLTPYLSVRKESQRGFIVRSARDMARGVQGLVVPRLQERLAHLRRPQPHGHRTTAGSDDDVVAGA